MKLLPMDGDKLYKIFKERELSITGVCREIGVNGSYFCNAKKRGIISELVVTALELHYNIPRSKYIIVEVMPEPVEPKKATLTKEMLYELIYSAVYNAMKKALNE